MMNKTNFHTHHYLCGHAIGNVKDYVLEAIKEEYSEIGISDHGPLPIVPPFKRMSFHEFETVYLKEIEECINEYNDKIKIYKGLEIEYVYGHDEFYNELKSKTDYLILALHYYSGYEKTINNCGSYDVNNHERLAQYTKLAIDAMNTGFFKIFAHPDICMAGYMEFDSFAEECVNQIIQAAIKNNVALELNCEGLRKGKRKHLKYYHDFLYPNTDFWKVVVKSDAKVIIGSDCHKPELLNDIYVEYAKVIAKQLKLNIINSIFE